MASITDTPLFAAFVSGNTVTGTSAGEDLLGLDGNDIRDGGGGIDTAIFNGARAEYTILGAGPGARAYSVQNAAAAGRIEAAVTGPEGTDTLVNVERLAFADGTLVLDPNDAAFQAFRLYRAALDRVPDTGGLGYQTARLDLGVSLEDVGAGFIASPEFVAKYGALDSAGYVSQLYANVLGRGAAAFEIAYHVARLDQGVSRQGVLIGFSESPENISNVAPLTQGGIWYTGWDVV